MGADVFSGCMPALMTPCAEDGTPDFDALTRKGRELIDHGMSQGAAMGFLVSGGVVSIWGAMAIFPVLRLKPFLLYLGLAVIGSMASGWAFEAITS